MNEFLWQAFVTLFVVIDPFAVAPAFMGLTKNDTPSVKKHIARKSCLIGVILLISFAILGDKLLDAMHISEPAFRMAGGFLLLLAAMEMVVGKNTGFRAQNADDASDAAGRDDISVYPLAIPLISGPGAITSTVVLMRQGEMIGYAAQGLLVLLIILVIYLTYITLRMGDYVMRFLGVTGINILTRVFGLILAAFAVQSMLHGLTSVLKAGVG
jgi:multiple antibiotic resistance protein